MKALPSLVLLLVACSPAPAPTGPMVVGCGKDTDCKGDRVCVEERCVSPAATAAPVVAAPEPSPRAAEPPLERVSPEPAPASASTLPPPPPTSPVHSGERGPNPCRCAAGDLMCAMKCAQKDNPARPPVSPQKRDRGF